MGDFTMGNVETLFKFFESENKRDWQQYKEYLHCDVEWVLFSLSKSQSLQGIDNYMQKILSAYEGNQDSFLCENYYSNQTQGRVITVLRNNHGYRSVDIFDFEDGLIKREYEFLLDE